MATSTWVQLWRCLLMKLAMMVILLLLPALVNAEFSHDRSAGGGFDPQSTQYVMKRTSRNPYAREVARCVAHNPRCHLKLLKCPAHCPKRVNSQFQRSACFIDCSANARPPASVANPIVMATQLCATVHNLWVGMMSCSTSMASVATNKKVATWDNNMDQLMFTFNDEEVTIPTVNGAMWRSPWDDIRVERVSEVNAVHVTIAGLMSANVEIVPISKEEDNTHNYNLPKDDVFAHLNVQFAFVRLSATVDGVLGQTYKPSYESHVKVGVPMPIMGEEEKFKVSSLFSTDCLVNRFSQPFLALTLSSPLMGSTKCTTTHTSGGILCRR
ncbi:hypothetical protein L7F22_021595 [Adiantum nelumboides]|nr:hypothetical protein [Adiantum nelumboides]